ncbi:glycoside hydrolase family 3 N-terminal domain-containing protein [Lutimonas zeaxanthinifaciens]|uniref:glycoside hydrolase family 3 N-terminal domain-containing protein n=1 Tax=Lutimonas zeaxanthinifaciens TaxID=3060215 RepID=UPI00265CCC3E|nr:glycoside hydrolase family 3 N-terminal domain-containing protein [Lutimonas sp. YSD2104]WKK65210.1 glycoside hydrolase family 3 N-terminal domain-containing protein [Lutimonas sp. YSD2104]
MNKIMLFLALIVGLTLQSQTDPLKTKDSIAQDKWVDSIMRTMSVEEKIGQLFMVAAYSNKDAAHEKFISDLITRHHIGALIFFQDQAVKQMELTNRYQSLSKVPLLIGIDGEWGLRMRLKNTVSFPYNMALGAIRDNSLLYDMGKQMGKHMKREGVHINFAPVVDVNTNPLNPVIGNRSYGEDVHNVTRKAIAFTKGIQSENIMACAKHFPGHGDTSQDSHKTLPSVNHDRARLDSVELYPYREIFKEGIGAAMVGHLSVPALEPNESLPSSLSHNIIAGLLKEEMGFKGLIVTDALNMKGSTNFASSEEINLQAILAGNDLLDVPLEVAKSIELFKKAYSKGTLTKERLDESVRKILKTKYWAGLNNYQPLVTDNLMKDLNSIEDDLMNRRLVESSITLVQNKNEVLPIKDLEKNRVAYIKIGKHNNRTFVKRLNDYAKVDLISARTLSEYLNKLKNYETVIVGFHTSLGAYANYKIADDELALLEGIAKKHKVILNLFASPYSLLKINSFENIDGIIVSYQNTALAQDISAQMIFGALDIKGMLPVNIKDDFKSGYGLQLSSINRLGYSIPEDVGLDRSKLKKIDSVAALVIDSAMAPGLHVLVARHGKVVFRESYGYYTYDQKKKVDNNSVYDLASVTKILGGLPMIIKAEEDGKFDLDSPLGELMPVLKGSNKDTVTVREALSHYAKLKPYIPYYETMVEGEDSTPMEKYFSQKSSSKYSIKVAENLYLRTDYQDTIYKLIAEAPQREELEYKYSGLPFYLFKDYLEKAYGQSLDELNANYFYKPLGATTLVYNPLNKIPKSTIVPTEDDSFFRHQLLHGNVHDEGAAMMGGVSGNAGLFGNANDVAKMMQMYLQKGYYGGKSYFKPESFDKFNKRYFEENGVRRGLGFDKPQLDESMATCGCISFKSFGHSGYTGTYTFADPETEIVYVFLSNRVYPTRENNKLGDADIRTVVQGLIQESIMD